MKPILFFDDSIKIKPHSATRKEDVGKVMTIAEFANGAPISLHKTVDDELFAVVNNKRLPGPNRFIQGPEVLS